MGALAVVAGGTILAGTALNVYGQIQSAKAQQAQQEFLAQQAEQNALLSESQAKDAYWRGERDEATFRENIEQVKGQQKVTIAGAGFDLSSGTAIDILNTTAEAAEKDAFSIRLGAQTEAYSYLMGAQNYEAEAILNRYAIGASEAALPYQVGGTILSGIGSTALAAK